MIARIWTGWTETAKADDYQSYMREVALPGYAGVNGNQGVLMLRRDGEGQRTEFTMISLWSDSEDIKRFAGDDPTVAVFYPRDGEFLVEADRRVRHHDVYAASTPFSVAPIGHVESPLADLSAAPLQADEGAPSAWLVFRDEVLPGLDGLRVGDRLVLVTWLHQADRDVVTVRPRGDARRPETGVFVTRSPDRPNPIGLHPVTVTDIAGPRVGVDHLEAVDGTPILDVKPVLGPAEER